MLEHYFKHINSILEIFNNTFLVVVLIGTLYFRLDSTIDNQSDGLPHDINCGKRSPDKLEKNKSGVCAIYGDVNGLRQYNLVRGYGNGDRQIEEMFRIIRNTIPPKARVYQNSGKEISILIPDMGLDEGKKICREIGNCISKHEELELDMAFGMAEAKGEQVDEYQLVVEAEKRMTRNKMLSPCSTKNRQLGMLLYILEEKSQETERHVRRVQENAIKIAKKMNLSESEINDLYLISVLHDIGKICVSDEILNKPGKLTREEWESMKQHSVLGTRIVRSIPEMVNISDAILNHHENWDGSGYPMGLRGDEIPLLARIIRVADSYDAMTENRVYSRAKSHDEAVSEIISCSGTQFEPQIVEIFLEILNSENEKADSRSTTCINETTELYQVNPNYSSSISLDSNEKRSLVKVAIAETIIF